MSFTQKGNIAFQRCHSTEGKSPIMSRGYRVVVDDSGDPDTADAAWDVPADWTVTHADTGIYTIAVPELGNAMIHPSLFYSSATVGADDVAEKTAAATASGVTTFTVYYVSSGSLADPIENDGFNFFITGNTL